MAAIPASLSSLATASDAAQARALTPSVVKLGNRQFELTLTLGGGLKCHLAHLPSGTVLAEGEYSYSFGTPPLAVVHKDDSSVVLLGHTNTGLTVEQRFTAHPTETWIEESIKITNKGPHPHVHTLRCGLVLPVHADTLKGYVFTAMPLRLDLNVAVPNGPSKDPGTLKAIRARKRYLDFSLNDILYGRRFYSDIEYERPEMQSLATPVVQRPCAENHAAEAWVLTDGRLGFVISKYNQTQREYAVLDRAYLQNGVTGLRWGGASPPDEMYSYIHLEPGASYEFGVTRLSAFQGGLTQGYYNFRTQMESRGHRTPEKFDPPLHWNELYDNKLCCADMTSHVESKNRDRLYRLDDMKQAASRAQAMGCDALYLDPGWDTPQSSKLWDERRLGKLPDFIAMLKNEHGGLRLSLHTPLSFWTGDGCDVPPGSALVNASGEETHFACGASRQYVEESIKRLRALADAGACFFMFDGAAYRSACWNPNHGHAVPSTIDEHMRATNELARMVHQTHPQVLVEMHDQGQWFPLLVPMYYGQTANTHGARGFDERWAFEYMWNPMEDLLSGNSLNLYYYSLAYSLPLYLHIDLRTDNKNALVFWWSASTCRHLGIGGTHADPDVVRAQQQAVRTYKRLKTYFARGTFFGIDEMTHVHSHPDSKSAVINCFNLEVEPTRREIRFTPREFGLATNKTYRFLEARFARAGDSYVGTVAIPALGHTLIEVT